MSGQVDPEKGLSQQTGNFKILIPPTYYSQLTASTTDDPKQSKHDNLETTGNQSRPEKGAAEGGICNPFTSLADRSFYLLATKSSDFDHPTSKIWEVYNSETAPFDKALIESWTKDMDGILIFVSFTT